jgi:hypothetical protein
MNSSFDLSDIADILCGQTFSGLSGVLRLLAETRMAAVGYWSDWLDTIPRRP